MHREKWVHVGRGQGSYSKTGERAGDGLKTGEDKLPRAKTGSKRLVERTKNMFFVGDKQGDYERERVVHQQLLGGRICRGFDFPCLPPLRFTLKNASSQK